MREFSSAAGVDSSDGEANPSKEPECLTRNGIGDLFTTFADRLADAGVEFGHGARRSGFG